MKELRLSLPCLDHRWRGSKLTTHFCGSKGSHEYATSSGKPTPIMTVERFLLRGVETCRQEKSGTLLNTMLAHSARSSDASTINQLKLRSRVVVRNGSPVLKSFSGCSGCSLSSCCKEMNMRKQHKQKRPFKKRIYEAAIATGVNPINDLVQPKDTPLSKAPLSFQDISPPQPRCSRGTVVVPSRRDNPFRYSHFFRAHNKSKPEFPLTRWQSPLSTISQLYHSRVGHYATNGTTTSGHGGGAGVTCSPLLFVPLSKAEDGYTAMLMKTRQ